MYARSGRFVGAKGAAYFVLLFMKHFKKLEAVADMDP